MAPLTIGSAETTGESLSRPEPSPGRGGAANSRPIVESRFPQTVEVRLPSYTAGGGYPFSGTVTGSISTVTNGLNCFAPPRSVVVRGGRISMIVTTALAASAPGFIGLFDGSKGGLLAVLADHCSTQQARTALAFNLEFSLREGQLVSGPLYIAGTQDIGAGAIACAGQLYGPLRNDG